MAASPTSEPKGRRRGTSVSSVAQSVVSATERVLDSDLPPGFLAATAEVTSKAPTLREIRGASLGSQDAGVPVRGRSGSRGRRSSARLSRTSRDQIDGAGQDHGHWKGEQHGGLEPFPPLAEESTRSSRSIGPEGIEKGRVVEREETQHSSTIDRADAIRPVDPRDRANTAGYIPPAKVPWTTSTANALKGFWKWFLTPFGFLVTMYGLNVVAWGGMLFLLLCNASPAMCYLRVDGRLIYDCNHIDSPRRIWIEIDSQILNALFCVTGFGLAPWRFRDLYYIMSYRLRSEQKSGLQKKMFGLRKLGGHYRNWFRLPGSDTLDQLTTEEYLRSIEKTHSPDLEAAHRVDVAMDPRMPIPATKAPNEPLTGVRAPATKLWKVDFFIHCQVWNTIFQICLCFFMWHLNRYDRPSWSTGLFVALACGVAGVGGLVSFLEGKKVKRVEGVIPSAAAAEAVGATTDGAAGVDLDRVRTGEEKAQLQEKAVKHQTAL